MLNFLKKKQTSLQLAYFLIRDSGGYDIVSVTGAFLDKHPQFLSFNANIIVESQNVIIAAGLIAIRLLTDVPFARAVVERAVEVYSVVKEEKTDTGFSPDDLENFKKRMDSYLVRFNRGMILRLVGNEVHPSIFEEAVKDLGNEATKFITGEPRSAELADFEDALLLQTRIKEEDELERHMTGVFRQFIFQYKKHFSEYRCVG